MIPITLHRSSRARRLRITIRTDRSVTVTAPRRVSAREIQTFVDRHTDWIMAKRAALAKLKITPLPSLTLSEQRRYAPNAKRLITKLVEEYSTAHDFSPGRISIRNQRTRWGSCSKEGNLNFNLKLLFLPPHLQQYVVLHELCHLQEFNHSRRFWALMRSIMPEYDLARRELRRYGLTTG